MKKYTKRIVLATVALLAVAGALAAMTLLRTTSDNTPTKAEPWQGGQTVSPGEQPYQNQLTGEVTDQDLSHSRPVAVVVDHNAQEAVSGLSAADIVYETAPAGGQTTQMIAVYPDGNDIPKVGPVGSVQEYVVSLTAPLSAAVVHSGGSDTGYTALQNGGFPEVDGLTEASAFLGNGYTSSELLTSVLNPGEMQLEQTATMPFLFSDKKPSFEGEANRLLAAFSDDCTVGFTYSEATGCYQKSQSGILQVDENTGQPIQVTNVLLLYASILPVADGSSDLVIDYSQGGAGIYACGGEYTNIRWNKESQNEPFLLMNSDGDALTLKPGKTWVCILPQESRLRTSIFS